MCIFYDFPCHSLIFLFTEDASLTHTWVLSQQKKTIMVAFWDAHIISFHFVCVLSIFCRLILVIIIFVHFPSVSAGSVGNQKRRQ